MSLSLTPIRGHGDGLKEKHFDSCNSENKDNKKIERIQEQQQEEEEEEEEEEQQQQQQQQQRRHLIQLQCFFRAVLARDHVMKLLDRKIEEINTCKERKWNGSD